MTLASVRWNCWNLWRKEKSSRIIWQNWLLTYTTLARKVRLNTSGCDSRWALTSKFLLLTLPTLLPFTSVFSRSKPTRQATTLLRHKQNHWLRSGSKRETRNPILGNETAKIALPFATNCFCEASLPTFAIEKKPNTTRAWLQTQPFSIHDHGLKRFQISCKDKVHISILCCSSDICAFTCRF
jgi:hypothetical protein